MNVTPSSADAPLIFRMSYRINTLCAPDQFELLHFVL